MRHTSSLFDRLGACQYEAIKVQSLLLLLSVASWKQAKGQGREGQYGRGADSRYHQALAFIFLRQAYPDGLAYAAWSMDGRDVRHGAGL